MPVTYSWYNDNQTVLLVEFKQKWAWDDMYRVRDAVLAESTGDNRVDVIADFSKTRHVPPNAMTHGRKALEKMHPNQGIQIFVGVPTMLKMMFDAAKTLMPQVIVDANFAFADTFDEALRIIETQ